jgi:predicted small integral membrane protein
MNPQLAKATAHITDVVYSITIAVIVFGVISLVAAKTIGGKTKRQQKLTAELVFAVGMLLFALVFLPRILAGGA